MSEASDDTEVFEEQFLFGNCTGTAPEKGADQLLNNQYYRLAYDFHRKWSPFPPTVKGWEDAGLEAADICFRHGNDPFLSDLLTAVMDDLGREYKKSGQEGGVK